MVKLSDIARGTEELKLPITGITVVFYDCLLVADKKKIEKIYADASASLPKDHDLKGAKDKEFKVEISLKAYTKSRDVTAGLIIKEWDLTDDDGKALPFSEKTVDLIPDDDYKAINLKINEIIGASSVDDEEKKDG